MDLRLAARYQEYMGLLDKNLLSLKKIYGCNKI